jgi:hypothetical protein
MALPATDVAFARCLFPTSRVTDPANLWENTPLFDQKWCALIGHHPETFELTKDLVQRSWAVLLRNYLREDIVTFACVGQKKNLENEESLAANVFRYELSAELPIGDVAPKRHSQINVKDLQGVQINTAIEFCGDQFEGTCVEAADASSKWFVAIKNVSRTL